MDSQLYLSFLAYVNLNKNSLHVQKMGQNANRDKRLNSATRRCFCELLTVTYSQCLMKQIIAFLKQTRVFETFLKSFRTRSENTYIPVALVPRAAWKSGVNYSNTKNSHSQKRVVQTFCSWKYSSFIFYGWIGVMIVRLRALMGSDCHESVGSD